MQFDKLIERTMKGASANNSIRQTALKLGITDVSFGRYVHWRKSNKFPSNETIFKMAEIANLDKIKSHFATMAAKTKDPEISKAYEALAQDLTSGNDH